MPKTAQSTATLKKSSKRNNKKKPKLNVQMLEEFLLGKEENGLLEVVATPTKQQEVKSPDEPPEKMLRFLTEKMYNNESSASKQLFKDDSAAFVAYHEGYKMQVQQWPINPLDVIIKSVEQVSKDYIIADFGCGEAKLANSTDSKM